MKLSWLSSMVRLATVALVAVSLSTAFTPTASAQSAKVSMNIASGGVVIGGTGGSGTLFFQGQSYPIRIGGLSVGFTLGFKAADVTGDVFNLTKVEDIQGTYVAAGASGALIAGAAVVSMTNGKGVTLNLRMVQVGLGYSLDLGGMNIILR